jgi:hypothetical protein
MKRHCAKHLYLIRGNGNISDDEFWEQRTVVIVVGDRAGFCHLAETIRTASSRSLPQRLAGLDYNSNTMGCLVLAPIRTPSKPARVMLFERIILVERKVRMELVFMGNPTGYARIAATIDEFGRTSNGDLYEHEHLDWTNAKYRSLLKNARVDLNLRSPVCPWSVGKLGAYRPSLFDQGTRYLPGAIDYPLPKDWRYIVPNPRHLARYGLTLT